MKTNKPSISRVIQLTAMILTLAVLFPVASRAATQSAKYPFPFYNLADDIYYSDGSQKNPYNYIAATDQGYMRVFCYLGEVNIEYYDKDFTLTETKKIEEELTTWGGFYKGEDAYYLVEGEDNENCVDGKEVIRIIKYDTSWNRLGSGSVLSNDDGENKISNPFNLSCVNMTEVGGNLYVITGREGYTDESIDQWYQGMILIRMDESTFETKVIFGDFLHSVSQYIDHKGSDIFTYEQSKGGRCTLLSYFDENSDPFTDRFSVLDYGGDGTSAGGTDCYATANDIALSSDNVLGIGTSIDQSRYNEIGENDPYNIYLTVTPLSNLSTEATTVKWLTSYKNTSKFFEGVNLTKINDDSFLVMWEEWNTLKGLSDKNDPLSEHTLHYVFVDGQGNKVSKEFKADAALSDCHPIVRENVAVFLASDEDVVDFYAIDTDTGSFSKRVYKFLDLSRATVDVPNKTYTGKAIKPVPVVKLDGKKLTKGVDYKVSYQDNIHVGEATVMIEGIGKGIGWVGRSFYIVPKGTAISKITSGKKSLTIKWKKQTVETSGYQIQYATNKGFTKGKKLITVKGNKTASKKIKKLKAKRTYYVRIRTYKTVGGHKYCSSWSKVKKVKTK